MLDRFEREAFEVAVAGLKARSPSIRKRMEERPSCEGYLNHLFARAFSDHDTICVRETPYMDLEDGENAPTLGPKAALDLMLLAPNKSRTVLIEAKLVHDHTIDGYRDRAERNGDSIYGDIRKIGRIPAGRGRSRLVMVMMVSLSGAQEPEAWHGWLRRGTRQDLADDFWMPLGGSARPLFSMGESGWFHIYLHRAADI
jgi:hypothetical protein